MSVIASVEIPAEEFLLDAPLDPERDVELTVETMVPTGEDVVPYLWVPSHLERALLEVLRDRRNVTTVSVVDEVDGYALVRIEWDGHANGVLTSIQQTDAIVTAAVGTGERWTFRLRFPSYEDLSTFYTTCLDHDVPVELVQLHEAVGPDADHRFGLTRPQREIVVAAYEAGYFDVPRKTTLVELGERLEISDSAVSQRLRRGLASLIDATLLVDSPQSGADATD